jgi:hypothetical protein
MRVLHLSAGNPYRGFETVLVTLARLPRRAPRSCKADGASRENRG